MKLRLMTKIIFLIVLLMNLIIPIIGSEILLHWDRSSKYPDLPLTEFRLTTEDGNSISVWGPDSSGPVLLFVHGHNDNSWKMFDWYAENASKYLPNYEPAFVDLRNHGRSSSSRPVTLGVEEMEDVRTAISFLASRHESVAVFGTSMGAVASLLAQNSNVSLLILDSFFLDFDQVFQNNLKKNSVPEPWRSSIIYYSKMRTPDLPNLSGILKAISIPTLIVHGTSDIEAPVSVLQVIESLTNENIITLSIDRGKHSRLFLHPEFWEGLSEFLMQ